MSRIQDLGNGDPCGVCPEALVRKMYVLGNHQWCATCQSIYTMATPPVLLRTPATRSAPDDEKSGIQARFTSPQLTDAAEATSGPGDREALAGAPGELMELWGK